MLALLIDENLSQRILRGLVRVLPNLDYVLVESVELKGADDPVVLDRAAADNRIFVTHDLKTVPKHAYERVEASLPMPGVIAVPDDLSIGSAIDDLAVVVECATAAELNLRVLYLPL